MLERRLQTMDKEYKLLKSGRGVESSGMYVAVHVIDLHTILIYKRCDDVSYILYVGL